MKRRVLAVVFDDFLLLDLAGPVGALEVANQFVADKYEVELVSVRGGPVRSSAGIVVDTTPFVTGGPLDLIFIPGGPGTRQAAENGSILKLIREASAVARRSASVCTGAFLLAAAGILNGRRATTHWAEAAALQRDYPLITIDSDRIFIEDDGVWTSAGITAGLDLTLALIEGDHGFEVSQRVARSLVVYHRRPGGQRQFSAVLEMGAPDGRFGRLLEWARERLHERLDIDRLAAECGFSPRHFSRAFTEATGMPPGKAIETMRVDAARADIATAKMSLEVIARRHGFGTAARMRRSFIRVLGVTPQAVRVRN